MIRVFTTDSTIHVKYATALREKADGQAMRTLIQIQILPALAADREALARVGRVSDHQRAILDDLRQYIALREESWRQRTRALDGDVPAHDAGVGEIDARADAILRRLLQARF